MKLKLKISKQAHLEEFYRFINNNKIDTGKHEFDVMINDILCELAHKIYLKIKNIPKTFDLTIKPYQQVALYTLYFEYSKTMKFNEPMTIYQNNIIQLICNQIHPKLL